MEYNKQQINVRMEGVLNGYINNLAKIRTGRAHAGLLDHIKVDYYGSYVPISQIANVAVSDTKTLSVQPWETPMINAIDKAIRESDLGLNPAINGSVIRVPMPDLTQERRKELVKVVKSEGEDAKVAIRNIRRDVNTALKSQVKDKQISEDEEKRCQDEVQKLTDNYVSLIDKALVAKEHELLTI